jgi:hypothetical protein
LTRGFRGQLARLGHEVEHAVGSLAVFER